MFQIVDTINEENDIEKSIENFILTYKDDVDIYIKMKSNSFKNIFLYADHQLKTMNILV